MRFTKMHGIGNDFIIIDAIHNEIADPSALAKRVCKRRFGVGADGLILICESDKADVKMRIFNSDGSEPEMCGNGIRCAAKYVYDKGICPKSDMTIDTLAGVLGIHLEQEGETTLATVNMGQPEFNPEKIPVAAGSNRVKVQLGGREVEFFCVSMGNPHAVTFDIFPDDEDFRRFGSMMECHPLFPAKANIEFCRVDDRENITVKVWERGDGPTLACGTGSCAVLAAAVSLGLAKRSASIHLPGGTLRDVWLSDNHITMTGPAETAFEGEIE